MQKSFLKLVIILGAFFLTTGCNNYSDDLYQGAEVETAVVDGLSYNILVKDHFLYCDDGKDIEKILDEKIIDVKAYDIDKDGDDELAVIDSVNENLIFFEIESTDNELLIEEIYRKDFSTIDPWMVEAGDVDGDGTVEIFMGVNKRTEFYEDVRYRPFYYSWDGERLQKKWTGSYFSEKELMDVKFADLFGSGRDETIAIERDTEGKHIVSIYGWLGFGFIKIAESHCYEDVDEVIISERDGGSVYVEVVYTSDDKTVREEADFVE